MYLSLSREILNCELQSLFLVSIAGIAARQHRIIMKLYRLVYVEINEVYRIPYQVLYLGDIAWSLEVQLGYLINLDPRALLVLKLDSEIKMFDPIVGT